MKIKKYECEICKRLSASGVRGEKRFISTREGVREHLRDVHHVKGRKNKMGLKKDEFGKSFLTASTISEVWE